MPPRVESIRNLIVPFRAPEIDREIKAFSRDEFFYHDEDQSVRSRFRRLDAFTESFLAWTGISFSGFQLYPVNGSTAAIDFCLYELKSRSLGLCVLKNEYRWYSYMCHQLGIPLKIVESSHDLDPSFVFVTSTPFCRDGDVSSLQLEILRAAESRNIEVWVDCAYFGSTPEVELFFPRTTENIFFSFSKQFALPFLRLGVWMRKRPLPNQDLLLEVCYQPLGGLALVTCLMNKFSNRWLHQNYSSLQAELTDAPSKIVYLEEDGSCLTFQMEKKLKDRHKFKT